MIGVWSPPLAEAVKSVRDPVQNPMRFIDDPSVGIDRLAVSLPLNNSCMNIGWEKKLRLLRMMHNYTQEYVAQALGIRQNSYSLIEIGSSRLRAVHIERIAALYRLSVRELEQWQPPSQVASNAVPISGQADVPRTDPVRELLDRLERRSDEAMQMNAELLRSNQRLMEVLDRHFGTSQEKKGR